MNPTANTESDRIEPTMRALRQLSRAIKVRWRRWLVSHFWRQILSPFSQIPLSSKAPLSDI